MPAVDPTYCPDCGSELERVEIEGRDRAGCPDCEEVWWRSSVPTTSVAVVDGEQVLLIQRSGGRDAGRWDLPAGHPEYYEPAREAVVRELHEETGVTVDPGAIELVGTTLSTGRRRTYRSINYRVDRAVADGDVTAGSDAADARFVTPDAVRAGDVDVRKLGRLRLRCAGLLD
jgi:ADP-ribose pyrophosphatase YjhB (NUDIX family)